MSKLSVDQKTVRELFSDKNRFFLIPDYQRPYAWGRDECETLWDDLIAFAFPDNDSERFNDKTDEYYLGSIVTFRNKKGESEIIDGQQRLTTLLLLLRILYSEFVNLKDRTSEKVVDQIGTCIWKTNEVYEPIKDKLKIDSQVATDDDKEEFLSILHTGEAPDTMHSRYAINYRFFVDKIQEFKKSFAPYLLLLTLRILNNVILLPIEADSQSTALRIFSTLNDRGLPLANSDIFKAQLYEYFDGKGQKDKFVDRWNSLDLLAKSTFHSRHENAMDELFTRYMYYLRAKEGITNTTIENIRDFYGRNNYAVLKRDQTLKDLESLANFWNKESRQDSNGFFSNEALKKFYVLDHAPNNMWTNFVSVYYLANKNSDGLLNDKELCEMLDRVIGLTLGLAIVHPGVNALRPPMISEMASVVKGHQTTFARYLISRNDLKADLPNTRFSNNRNITRSMLTWWAMTDPDQKLIPSGTEFDIEHIYARNRQDKEEGLSNPRNLDALGNKSLLERGINIRASDYRFVDKKDYYLGRGKKGEKGQTRIADLVKLAARPDFTEEDIVNRTQTMFHRFVHYLDELQLLKE